MTSSRNDMNIEMADMGAQNREPPENGELQNQYEIDHLPNNDEEGFSLIAKIGFIIIFFIVCTVVSFKLKLVFEIIKEVAIGEYRKLTQSDDGSATEPIRSNLTQAG
ncbi:hypothetical protein GCK72_023010 [Caenorhabditis remanei]|uniref:Uncharacterized protein n=1 Tax=Caenorhabditis remanei TaxID=31234 RepID=A0A6A5FVI4_CAERE|nr:hypothetical protein GCK72_023010 [Caenorhabditis remanei]KAF1746553.1 hypothetical protein GCK72_023010 [Caenorhabditis remanei]